MIIYYYNLIDCTRKIFSDDDNIFCRQEDLSLQSDAYGTPILPEGKVLMEIKCSGGIPLWMTEVLSRERLYKTSFSKYGTAYKMLIFPKTHKMNVYNMSKREELIKYVNKNLAGMGREQCKR